VKGWGETIDLPVGAAAGGNIEKHSQDPAIAGALALTGAGLVAAELILEDSP